MTKQQEIGRKGEEIAQAHLISSNYEILETNWHYHHYEIDIIAKDIDKNELVIVEVKSRSGYNYEHPSEAVSNRKIRFLIDAAEAYIFKTNSDIDTRFDIISIIFSGDKFQLEHIKDAFYPT